MTTSPHGPLQVVVLDLSDPQARQFILTNGPYGRWRTVPGTHTSLFQDSLFFDEGGRGEMRTSSLMRGEQLLRFEWRMAGQGVVECRTMQDAGTDADEDEDEDEDDWDRLPFVVEQHATDAGTYWVIKDPNAQGFWDLALPLVPA